FFFSSRRRHTSFSRDWSSDVCSSDLACVFGIAARFVSRPLQPRCLARPPLREGGRALAVCWLCVSAHRIPDRLGERMKPAHQPQIGRASCRESVWFSTVAV